MLKVKPIETETEKIMMELDIDCVPKEQVCLLRNFEMFEEKQITEKERNRIDMLLLSDDPENISLGIKIVEAKMEKHGRRTMETA